jgi:hypothetical protein
MGNAIKIALKDILKISIMVINVQNAIKIAFNV